MGHIGFRYLQGEGWKCNISRAKLEIAVPDRFGHSYVRSGSKFVQNFVVTCQALTMGLVRFEAPGTL